LPDIAPPPDGPLAFDLDEINNIYLVGGGKAAQRQAQAIEDVLGDLITEGHINAKKGDEVYLKRVEVTLAGHPTPDEDSVAGAKRILEVELKAKKGDIVFLSESGGGTALMALPAPGISLSDLQEVNRLLYFGCGAPMPVANAVRNQLVLLRARHARHVGEATLLHIATPELPPNMVVHLFDERTRGDPYQEAIDILRGYGIWDAVPESVRAFLLEADPAYGPVTPAEWCDNPRYYFRVMGPEYMLDAAQRRAEELGLNATVLVSSLSDIEAQPAGEVAAYVAQEIEVLDRPLAAPCVLLLGGELVVSVGEEMGCGGRNQEFVLAAAQRIAGSGRIVIGSADSDGCDGPTDVAGGIVDGYTTQRASQAGIDLCEALRRHDACSALTALGDTIYTGVQKTNVRDLRVIYVGSRAA
jgi:glycerate 2-kinase